MMDEDSSSNLASLDLYDDLITDEGLSRQESYDELARKYEAALTRIGELESEVQTLRESKSKLAEKYTILEKNTSVLFVTARLELERKERTIQKLQHERNVRSKMAAPSTQQRQDGQSQKVQGGDRKNMSCKDNIKRRLSSDSQDEEKTMKKRKICDRSRDVTKSNVENNVDNFQREGSVCRSTAKKLLEKSKKDLRRRSGDLRCDKDSSGEKDNRSRKGSTREKDKYDRRGRRDDRKKDSLEKDVRDKKKEVQKKQKEKSSDKWSPCKRIQSVIQPKTTKNNENISVSDGSFDLRQKLARKRNTPVKMENSFEKYSHKEKTKSKSPVKSHQFQDETLESLETWGGHFAISTSSPKDKVSAAQSSYLKAEKCSPKHPDHMSKKKCISKDINSPESKQKMANTNLSPSRGSKSDTQRASCKLTKVSELVLDDKESISSTVLSSKPVPGGNTVKNSISTSPVQLGNRPLQDSLSGENNSSEDNILVGNQSLYRKDKEADGSSVKLKNSQIESFSPDDRNENHYVEKTETVENGKKSIFINESIDSAEKRKEQCNSECLRKSSKQSPQPMSELSVCSKQDIPNYHNIKGKSAYPEKHDTVVGVSVLPDEMKQKEISENSKSCLSNHKTDIEKSTDILDNSYGKRDSDECGQAKYCHKSLALLNSGETISSFRKENGLQFKGEQQETSASQVKIDNTAVERVKVVKPDNQVGDNDSNTDSGEYPCKLQKEHSSKRANEIKFDKVNTLEKYKDSRVLEMLSPDRSSSLSIRKDGPCVENREKSENQVDSTPSKNSELSKNSRSSREREKTEEKRDDSAYDHDSISKKQRRLSSDCFEGTTKDNTKTTLSISAEEKVQKHPVEQKDVSYQKPVDCVSVLPDKRKESKSPEISSSADSKKTDIKISKTSGPHHDKKESSKIREKDMGHKSPSSSGDLLNSGKSVSSYFCVRNKGHSTENSKEISKVKQQSELDSKSKLEKEENSSHGKLTTNSAHLKCESNIDLESDLRSRKQDKNKSFVFGKSSLSSHLPASGKKDQSIEKKHISDNNVDTLKGDSSKSDQIKKEKEKSKERRLVEQKVQPIERNKQNTKEKLKATSELSVSAKENLPEDQLKHKLSTYSNKTKIDVHGIPDKKNEKKISEHSFSSSNVQKTDMDRSFKEIDLFHGKIESQRVNDNHIAHSSGSSSMEIHTTSAMSADSSIMKDSHSYRKPQRRSDEDKHEHKIGSKSKRNDVEMKKDKSDMRVMNNNSEADLRERKLSGKSSQSEENVQTGEQKNVNNVFVGKNSDSSDNLSPKGKGEENLSPLRTLSGKSSNFEEAVPSVTKDRTVSIVSLGKSSHSSDKLSPDGKNGEKNTFSAKSKDSSVVENLVTSEKTNQPSLVSGNKHKDIAEKHKGYSGDCSEQKKTENSSITSDLTFSSQETLPEHKRAIHPEVSDVNVQPDNGKHQKISESSLSSTNKRKTAVEKLKTSDVHHSKKRSKKVHDEHSVHDPLSSSSEVVNLAEIHPSDSDCILNEMSSAQVQHQNEMISRSKTSPVEMKMDSKYSHLVAKAGSHKPDLHSKKRSRKHSGKKNDLEKEKGTKNVKDEIGVSLKVELRTPLSPKNEKGSDLCKVRKNRHETLTANLLKETSVSVLQKLDASEHILIGDDISEKLNAKTSISPGSKENRDLHTESTGDENFIEKSHKSSSSLSSRNSSNEIYNSHKELGSDILKDEKDLVQNMKLNETTENKSELPNIYQEKDSDADKSEYQERCLGATESILSSMPQANTEITSVKDIHTRIKQKDNEGMRDSSDRDIGKEIHIENSSEKEQYVKEAQTPQRQSSVRDFDDIKAIQHDIQEGMVVSPMKDKQVAEVLSDQDATGSQFSAMQSDVTLESDLELSSSDESDFESERDLDVKTSSLSEVKDNFKDGIIEKAQPMVEMKNTKESNLTEVVEDIEKDEIAVVPEHTCETQINRTAEETDKVFPKYISAYSDGLSEVSGRKSNTDDSSDNQSDVKSIEDEHFIMGDDESQEDEFSICVSPSESMEFDTEEFTPVKKKRIVTPKKKVSYSRSRRDKGHSHLERENSSGSKKSSRQGLDQPELRGRRDSDLNSISKLRDSSNRKSDYKQSASSKYSQSESKIRSRDRYSSSGNNYSSSHRRKERSRDRESKLSSEREERRRDGTHIRHSTPSSLCKRQNTERKMTPKECHSTDRHSSLERKSRHSSSKKTDLKPSSMKSSAQNLELKYEKTKVVRTVTSETISSGEVYLDSDDLKSFHVTELDNELTSPCIKVKRNNLILKQEVDEKQFSAPCYQRDSLSNIDHNIGDDKTEDTDKTEMCPFTEGEIVRIKKAKCPEDEDIDVRVTDSSDESVADSFCSNVSEPDKCARIRPWQEVAKIFRVSNIESVIKGQEGDREDYGVHMSDTSNLKDNEDEIDGIWAMNTSETYEVYNDKDDRNNNEDNVYVSSVKMERNNRIPSKDLENCIESPVSHPEVLDENANDNFTSEDRPKSVTNSYQESTPLGFLINEESLEDGEIKSDSEDKVKTELTQSRKVEVNSLGDKIATSVEKNKDYQSKHKSVSDSAVTNHGRSFAKDKQRSHTQVSSPKPSPRKSRSSRDETYRRKHVQAAVKVLQERCREKKLTLTPTKSPRKRARNSHSSERDEQQIFCKDHGYGGRDTDRLILKKQKRSRSCERLKGSRSQQVSPRRS